MRLFLLFFFYSSIVTAKPIPHIKIKLNLKKPIISLYSEQQVSLVAKGKSRNYRPKTKIKIRCKKFDAAIRVPELFAQVSSKGRIIQVNSDIYRGRIKIYKDHKKKYCFTVGEMDVEDYIQSILPKEMNASWPLTALQAQAVASRTYALHRVLKMNQSKKRSSIAYHLENSEKDQVTGSLKDWTKKTAKAIMSTRGQVLVNKVNELVPTFFHAKCGGSTLTPGQVWGASYASYRRVKDPYCKKIGKASWNHEISKKDFRRLIAWHLKRKTGSTKKFGAEVLTTDSVYRAYLKVYLGRESHLIPKSHFRKFFGRVKIRSNHFKLVRNLKGDYQVTGRGHGHGVGMCQIGALGISKIGMDYKDILRYYYPGLNLVTYL